MGALGKLVDGVLFVFFVIVAIALPLLDCQVSLPQHQLPAFMVDFYNWYTQFTGDYLIGDKPHWFVGIVWVEILLMFPLSVAGIYAMVARKPWLNAVCLMLGTSVLTSTAGILGELILSNRAPTRVYMLYSPFLGLSALTMLRGLIVDPEKNITQNGNGHLLHTKKKA